MIFTIIKKVLWACSMFFLVNTFSPTTRAAMSAASLPPHASSAQERRKISSAPEKLPHFKGIGNANGKVDTGFIREEKYRKPLEDEENQSGIKLPPGLQKFVDNAGKTIKELDEATLRAVNASLDFLGIEAESAKIRPTNGGIGLGVSIKLDRSKKPAGNSPASAGSERSALYEVLTPPNRDDHSQPKF